MVGAGVEVERGAEGEQEERIDNELIQYTPVHHLQQVKKGRILEYINNYKHTEWLSSSSPVMVKPSTEPVGPKQDLSDSRNGIISLMFTPDVISHRVRERNRYAAQCLEGTDKEWGTKGFVVLMGTVQEPEIRDYWAQSPLLHYSPIG